MEDTYDFSGWATRNNVKCSDGRTIMENAFAHNDGQTVPLVWDHLHTDPLNVLGRVQLENRPEGVYAYGAFNDSMYGQAVKAQVQHGDITRMSIYANHLKERGGAVFQGDIKEVSLVIGGANPGAYIDNVIVHGDEDGLEAVITTGEEFEIHLEHSDKEEPKEKDIPLKDDSETENKTEPEEDMTIGDVINSLNGIQKKVVYGLLAQALDSGDDSSESDKEERGGKEMKHNMFEDDGREGAVLSHSDQEAILKLAKSNSVGTLQGAIERYFADNKTLAHSIDDIETLFPDYADVKPGAPELVTRDREWVNSVISGVHKSPMSRIRTRQADARAAELRAMGFKKGKKKVNAGNIKLIKRTTDPQTVYRKDALNRDDIVDITEFDVVEYTYQVMRGDLYEEIATAIMIGDGRDDGDEQKISEEHIRPIWTDDDLYTIHKDVNIAAARNELQGTNTGANFGENYIYAEAIVTAALHAREQYKGSGSLTFYCTPHLANVMMLARDLNGRRIYNSLDDLARALNVKEIVTVEQFEDKVRTTSVTDGSKKKKLLGLFVNLNDYVVGSTKGGEITRFNQFDIDFNLEKYLIETRLSGALASIYSAIALEEDVTASSSVLPSANDQHGDE